MGAPKSGATPRGGSGTGGGARGGGGAGSRAGRQTPPRGTAAGELAEVERLRRRLPRPPEGQVWIGDDAAVLGRVGGPLVCTTDCTVAGVHGDPRVIGLADFGWRALARAVSDVAAMGARCDGAVVAVAGPPDTDLATLYDGIVAAAAGHGCPVVGGDLSGAAQLVVVVTVAGHVDAPPGPVLRSGARAGDALFVTGPLGGAAAGLRWLSAGHDPPTGSDMARAAAAHRHPWARLDEGDAARRAGASAMIDVSDGLLLDLSRLADASGVGFVLDTVPVAGAATLEDALGGGEDYELVVAASDVGALCAAFAADGLRSPARIGTCVENVATRTLAGEPTEPVGWRHRWD